MYQIDQQQIQQIGQASQPEAAPEPAAPQPNTQTAPAPKKGKGKAKKAIAGLAVVVLIVAAYLLLLQKPASSSAIYSSLAPGKTLPLNKFVQLVNSSIFYANRTNVSYSGAISFNESSSSFSTSYTVPMHMTLLKNGSDERAYLSVKMPYVGNLSIIEISKGGKYYACVNSTSLPVGTVNSTNSSYVCIYQAAMSNFIGLRNNVSGMVHVLSSTKSSYNGRPCILVKGYLRANESSLTSSLSSLSTPASNLGNMTANFSMCLAENTNMLLSLLLTSHSAITNPTTNASASLSMTMSLNETALSSVVPGNLATLPGPVLNSTELSSLGIS